MYDVEFPFGEETKAFAFPILTVPINADTLFQAASDKNSTVSFLYSV